MAKYKETNIQGSSYVRTNKIIINNYLSTPPNIQFEEESVLNVNDIQQTVYKGMCKEMFITSGSTQNINEEFSLIDPSTGDETGEVMKYINVYNILYSLYLHVARKRDNDIIK